MPDKLANLIERARRIKMTPEEKEQQRRSFAFGNTSFENDRITRRMVDEAAEHLRKDEESKEKNA